MKKLTLIVAFISVFVPIMLAAVDARAQDLELDSIVVEGRILRPQAAYIIQRANVEFGIEAKKRSFVQKIEESLDETPFQ